MEKSKNGAVIASVGKGKSSGYITPNGELRHLYAETLAMELAAKEKSFAATEAVDANYNRTFDSNDRDRLSRNLYAEVLARQQVIEEQKKIYANRFAVERYRLASPHSEEAFANSIRNNALLAAPSRWDSTVSDLDRCGLLPVSASPGGNREITIESLSNDDTDLSFEGTWGIGYSAALAAGIRLSGGKQLVIDGQGNIGIVISVGGGGGTPTCSAGGTVSYTNADSICDLAGWGGDVGASFSGILGGEYVSGSNYAGGSYTPGFSPLPEMHGEVTFSRVYDLTPILEATGLYEVIYSLLQSAAREGAGGAS